VACGGTLRRIRIFADSNSDWLDDKWPIETLADLLKDIHDCPNIDFQLLTKRPENFKAHGGTIVGDNGMKMPVQPRRLKPMGLEWVGQTKNHPKRLAWGSVEDQKRADERIPLLLQIPAKVRFLSVEPLLEKVDLNSSF
jgi:protein gp37